MLPVLFKYPVISKVLLSEVRSIRGITQRCFKHNQNVSSPGLSVRTFLTRCMRSDGSVRQTRFLKPKNSHDSSVRHQQTSKWDVNTKVQNNVILYRYERLNQYLSVQLFVYGQLFGWSVLAAYVYRPGFFDIFTTDIKLHEYWDKYSWRIPIFISSIFLGPALFALFYFLTARTIKYIILHKGGETITLVTHHFFKSKSTLKNLSLDSVRCTSHRLDAGVYIALKVENKSLYYLIEKSGTFVNPELFDQVM